MKKCISFICVTLMLLSLCACGAEQQTTATSPTQGAYQDIIDKLDAGDFDGARALIDAMEGSNPKSTQAASTIPGAAEETDHSMTQPQTGTVVELTKENVEDYFEVITGYTFGPAPGFFQAVSLKEAYADRIVSMEGVTVKVSYLLSNAYGMLDAENEEFLAARYEIIDGQPQSLEANIYDSGMISLAQSTYNKKNGYFPNFAVDVEFTEAAGTIILSD